MCLRNRKDAGNKICCHTGDGDEGGQIMFINPISVSLKWHIRIFFCAIRTNCVSAVNVNLNNNTHIFENVRTVRHCCLHFYISFLRYIRCFSYIIHVTFDGHLISNTHFNILYSFDVLYTIYYIQYIIYTWLSETIMRDD